MMGVNRKWFESHAVRPTCQITGEECARPGCGTRNCVTRSHLGRLSQAAVAKLLRSFTLVGPSEPSEALLVLVRQVLSDPELGPIFHQALVEESLSADPAASEFMQEINRELRRHGPRPLSAAPMDADHGGGSRRVTPWGKLP